MTYMHSLHWLPLNFIVHLFFKIDSFPFSFSEELFFEVAKDYAAEEQIPDDDLGGMFFKAIQLVYILKVSNVTLKVVLINNDIMVSDTTLDQMAVAQG